MRTPAQLTAELLSIGAPAMTAIVNKQVTPYSEPEGIARNKAAYLAQWDAEIFTSVFDRTWGNLELRFAGEDTGYDIRGRWFKLGTRLVDADDNDLIVAKTDVWSGRNMTIEVMDENVSGILIAATLYHHIRASAAAGLVAAGAL